MSCFKYSFHLFDSVRHYFKFIIIILYIYYIYIYLYIYARIYIYVYVYYIFINIGFPHIIQVKTEQIQNGENKIIFEIWQFLFFSVSFVVLSFFNLIMYAAVWLFTQLPYLFIIHQPHLPYISLLLCSPPPSFARSFVRFILFLIYFTYFFCVVSQINYMRCFMRCHNSISCTFFVF